MSDYAILYSIFAFGRAHNIYSCCEIQYRNQGYDRYTGIIQAL